jgi:hypothetical protein
MADKESFVAIALVAHFPVRHPSRESTHHDPIYSLRCLAAQSAERRFNT